jgi:methylated-DNA-[protein]-cysteine S-methyltransferase
VPQLSLHSPVGDLTVSEEDGVIVSLDWGWGAHQQESPVLREACRQLNGYFDGELTDFDLPLAPQGTVFHVRVWQQLSAIPYGVTWTYGAVANALQSGPRPVGTACGRNPIPIIIPCHRVLAAGGRMGGYSGEGGLDTKRHLLVLEGALQLDAELPFTAP